MPNLISFIINLKNYKFHDLPAEPDGPLFSRFLPNGRDERIEKVLEEGVIRYWFERRGFHDENGWIIYDVGRKEIDSNRIKNQGIIRNGHLFGELELLETIPLEVLQLTEPNGAPLVSALKPVIKLIARETKLLLDVLRFNLGHYWIIEDVDWDSRTHNMGAHCETLHLRYLNDANEWIKIAPENAATSHTIISRIGQNFTEYLTEENWQKFSDLVAKNHSPSSAQKHLIKAFSKLDSGDLERAYIDAVTVLEFALDKWFREIKKKSNKIGDSMKRLKELGNKEQLAIIFSRNAQVSIETLELALNAIDIRNKIIHEGYNPKSNERPNLEALLSLCAKIIDEPVSKLITHNPGNYLGPQQ